MENTDKKSMEKIVRSLVEQYGKELYLPENELRFKGLLFDFASDFAKELKTLKVALSERIPAKLLACDDKNDEEKSRTLQHCKDTLVDGVGLMEDRVIQVLNILTFGLGWGILLEGEVDGNSDANVVKKENKSEVEGQSCDDSSCTDTDGSECTQETEVSEEEMKAAASWYLKKSIENNNSPKRGYCQTESKLLGSDKFSVSCFFIMLFFILVGIVASL